MTTFTVNKKLQFTSSMGLKTISHQSAVLRFFDTLRHILTIGTCFFLASNQIYAQRDIKISTVTTELTSGVSTFDFGDAMIDYPVAYFFIVENVGDADLTIAATNSVTFGGPDPEVFSTAGIDGTVLAAGGIVVFDVNFIATASGMKSTIVTVESDDPDEGSFTFTVTGNAIDKPLACEIPNGGFEFSNTVSLPQLNFSTFMIDGATEYETPAGWSAFLSALFALFGSDVNVAITSDARTGSGALELIGDGVNLGDVLTVLPCSASQPATLQGYYKFIGAPTDSAMVVVSTGGGDEMNRTDANSDTLYIKSDAATYTMFQIDFAYDANSVDSLLVHIFTTNNGGSTILKVDDLEIMAGGGPDADPIFVSANTANFAENGTGTVLDVNANDGDGGATDSGITYSLTGGADQADFNIDLNSGFLTFSVIPDFENPADENSDNVYALQITADDGTSTVDQSITVTVTDVNEVANAAPIFTSANTVNFAENSTGTVLDIDANDGDGGAADLGITYSSSGGPDDVDFKIDQNTGMLTFVIVPDFESPQDDNSDNTYILKVAASDGVNSTDQTITIIVTEVNENPIIQSETLTIDENSSYGFVVGTILATDPDGDALNFEIESGNTDNAFSLNNSNGVLTVNNSAALDYETAPFFDLLVTVNDGRGGIAATIIVVQLDDLNETVTGIFDNVQNDNLKLFPNPVGDSFRFSDRGLKIREVLLYKLDGSLIRQFNGVQSHYDVRNLKAGTYLIRVNSEGKNYFQRLLKN